MIRKVDWLRFSLNVFLILSLIFIISPLVTVAIYSFSPVSYSVFPPEGFSLRWYSRLWDLDQFKRAFANSIVVGVCSTAISLVLGTMSAIVIARYRFRGRGTLNAVFHSPVVIPKVVMGLGFFILFLRWQLYGGLFGVTIAHAVITFPFVLAMVYSGMASVNPALEEAAMDLGAHSRRAFLDTVVPQVKPSLLIASLFAFVVSFDQVDATLFLVRQNSNTFPIEIFLYTERWQDPTMAALSTFMMAVIVLAVVLSRRIWARFVPGQQTGP